MQELNLPKYTFRIEKSEGKSRIFDRFRKRFVVLTPEEWVRQNFLMFLIREKNFPESLITVEAGLSVAKRSKRTDIVVYNKSGKPFILIECKAPGVKITNDTFHQTFRYNLTLNVSFLIVTNGLEHYFCKLDYENKHLSFLEHIPDFHVLT